MKLTIHGCGYVGLVSGACLAETGNQVVCIDVDADKIASLQDGETGIHEPGLDELIERNLAAGRLLFITNVEEGVRHGIFQFIAVDTPPDQDGSANLNHVLDVADSIGDYISEYRIIITKSTVPVGTTHRIAETVREAMQRRHCDIEFDTVSNPEFLKEGAAVDDFMKPDRIIVGSDNLGPIELLKTLYEPFTRNHERMIRMDVRSAELTKYAANAMLATKISLMNELANLAERVGADIESVRIGIGSDPRIGYDFIYPGCGYGGSCSPKDVRALAMTARQLGYQAELLDAVQNVNERQKQLLFQKLSAYFAGQLAGKTIAVWGLAFKPNTDDMRDASSRDLMEALWAAGARVRAYDPVAVGEAGRLYGERDDLILCASAAEAATGADALAIVTEWHEFRSPDFDALRDTLLQPVIFDGRNLYDPRQMAALGFGYFAIGRGDSIEMMRDARGKASMVV